MLHSTDLHDAPLDAPAGARTFRIPTYRWTDHGTRVAEVVDSLGFGWAQIKVAIVGGGIWFGNGVLLLLLGSVARAVAKEWELRHWERGLVVSVVFVGMFLGNLISGPLGDSHGRRLTIQISLVVTSLGCFCSSFCESVKPMIFLQAVSGLGFGIGQPAWSALATEVSPTDCRMLMFGVSCAMYTVGEIYIGLFIWHDDPSMEAINWRWLLLCASVPSVLFCILSLTHLIQSPSYLAMRGDVQGAMKVLKTIASDNNVQNLRFRELARPTRWRGDDSIESLEDAEKIQESRVQRQFRIVFGSEMLTSTLTMVYSTFVLNVVFYGCLYAFHQVVSEVNLGGSPAWVQLVGVFWELPGFALGILCGMKVARKPSIFIYLLLTAVALLLFTLGASSPSSHGHWAWWAMYVGYIGIKVTACMGLIFVYLYGTEIYPTEARTTGAAVCLAGGRLGGFSAPLLYEFLYARTGSFVAYFYVVICLSLANLVLIYLMPDRRVGLLSDTRQEALDEILPMRASWYEKIEDLTPPGSARLSDRLLDKCSPRVTPQVSRSPSPTSSINVAEVVEPNPISYGTMKPDPD